MRKIRNLWRNLYDVRPGERARTLFMALYLMFVLFSYYILKSVSEGMFLSKFDIDKLPYLYIFIAAFGGALAYVYSKLAARTSLGVAVFWTMLSAVASLVIMWWFLRNRNPVMIYVFNVWVRLFSIVTVAQGWLVASNIFNAREAKRVYGPLGLGMVLGAVFGGEFTNRMVRLIREDNLLLASAALCVLAYAAYLCAVSVAGGLATRVVGAEAESTDFSFRDVANDIGRSRHLQVLIAIMSLQFIIDTMVDYQFKAMAKEAYRAGPDLTAFLGRFYGRYLNLTEIVFQFFLTTAVIRHLGVGGTLQIMPISLATASLGTVAVPSVLTASGVRLIEASTRYTLTRTGMELLYMPLPRELRNRIKAFIDIFVDRAARGISGGILIVATQLALSVRVIALMVIAITIPWILLTRRAHKEYVATIRKRLAARRLDLEAARITVGDADTIRMLEHTARGDNPRQATYALSLLGEAPGYNLRPLLAELSSSVMPEVRAQVYTLARSAGAPEVMDAARREQDPVAVKAAMGYLLAVSPDARDLTREYLESSDPRAVEAALESASAAEIAPEWITRNASDHDPRRRALAAVAIPVAGDPVPGLLNKLLDDPDPVVITAACAAAGRLRDRAYLHGVIRHLADSRVRGAAIDALAQYGPAICGALSDLLEDRTIPVRLRRNVPRVLKAIPDQRSVDVLLRTLESEDLAIRGAVLRALNRLRETDRRLDFEDAFVTRQILKEARYYFELTAALEPFRDRKEITAPSWLLARTLEERLKQSLERLFRLLGLKYPPKEIHSAYLAIQRHKGDEHASAMEFLDSILERDIKRILIPLLDAPDNAAQRGREIFGLETRDAESAIRELIRSRDPWLVACAMAAAAELGLRSLAPAIAEAAREAEPEVYQVALSVQEALAA